jgi:hypothetical protein
VVIDDDTLPLGSPPTLEEYHRLNRATPAPAISEDAPIRRKRGRPATRGGNRQRRWPPGRACDRCGAPLSEYQSRYCSKACRYPDRPVNESSAAVSAPQIESESSLAFLQALPSFVTAVERTSPSRR